MNYPLIPTDFGHSVQTPSGVLAIRQVFGIGLNYAQHASEQGSALPERPVIFCKNIMSIARSGQPIVIPTIAQDQPQTDFEGELAVVIGKTAKDVPEAEALSYVLGYAAANDVSARWWQKVGGGGQFCRGKGFDTYCPMGDVMPASAVANPNVLRLVTKLNDEVMQDSNTSDMVFSVARIIAELSRGTTLVPGTVILTGTPQGVGMARKPPVFLKAGDIVEITIESVGTVVSPVVLQG